MSSFQLNGKNILITGASSGLGACTAIECSKLGAKLIISGRNPDKLDSIFKKLSGEGHIQIPIDFSDNDQIEKFSESLPNIDGVALCAGITKTLPVKFISKKAVDEVFQTNIFSSIYIIYSSSSSLYF